MSKRKTKKPPLYMVLTLNGFEPAAEMDADSLREYYTIGGTYQIDAKKPRSLPQLRQWWGVLRWLHFHDRFGYSSPEQINKAILIEQNLTSPVRHIDGSVHMIPDSTAFDNMDSKTFSHFKDRGLQIIHEHWGFNIKTMLEEGIRLTVPKNYMAIKNVSPTNERIEAPNPRDLGSEIIWDESDEEAA